MENFESNPFFDPELLKLLKKPKPNSAEEELKYTSDLLEAIELVVVDTAEEFENYLTSSFPIPHSFKTLFVHQFVESEEIKGYLNPKISLIFASQSMDCFYHFKCDAQVVEKCPLEIIQSLFENELYHGEAGK